MRLQKGIRWRVLMLGARYVQRRHRRILVRLPRISELGLALVRDCADFEHARHLRAEREKHGQERIRAIREEIAATEQHGPAQEHVQQLTTELREIQAEQLRSAMQTAHEDKHLLRTGKRLQRELRWLYTHGGTAARQARALFESMERAINTMPAPMLGPTSELPGNWVRALLNRLYGPKAMARIFDPIIADMQYEWSEAFSAGSGRLRLRFIRLQGYLALMDAILADVAAALRRARLLTWLYHLLAWIWRHLFL